MKNIKKSLSFLMILIILICSFTGCGKKEEIVEIDSQITELIIKADQQFDRMLSVDNLEDYNIVGYIAEETVYGFTKIQSSGLMTTLQKNMDKQFILKELKIRGFAQGHNNILFVGTEDFYKQQELNKLKIKDIQKVQEAEIIMNLPELHAKISVFEEQGFYNFQYFKTMLQTEDFKQRMEIIYLIGQNENKEYKILDAIYYVNGEKTNTKTNINLSKIESFTPNTFEKETNTNLGQVDRVIERIENYQGSIPYVEQNLEENNKAFE